MLSATRFGYTYHYECFCLELKRNKISAQVPSSATRIEKGSKSFTLAIFAPKQIISLQLFTAVLREVTSGCVLKSIALN